MHSISFTRWAPPAMDQPASAAAPPPTTPPTTPDPAPAQRNAGTPGAPQNAMRGQLQAAWNRQRAGARHTVVPAGMLDGALLGANCFFPIGAAGDRAPYRHKPADIAALQRNIARFNQALRAREHAFPTVHFHAPAHSPLTLPKATCLQVEGQFIDANYIHLSSGAKKLGREAVAIACAFPLRHQLGRHFHMLHQERPSVLVVLTESDELEEDRSEYFKHGGRFGDIQVHVAPGPAIMPPGAQGLAMQCYELSIEKAGQATVSTPVIHVTNWKDGTAVAAEQMMPLVNLMRFTQAKDESAGPLRPPLVHCKAGVGRTAETVGAYLLAHDPDVRSAEGLIKDLKSSRGSWMAYVDAQQAELGRIAAMREMPVVAAPMMQSSLAHLGYTDVGPKADDDFMRALDDIGCIVETISLPLQQALLHLADPDAGAIEEAMLLRVLRDGQAVHRMLWSGADDKLGLDAGDGELFRDTPLAFCERLAASPGAASAVVDIVAILPSLVAGEIGLFTRQPGAKSQCDMAAYMVASGIHEMSDMADIEAFLQFKGLETFAYDVDLATGRAGLTEALERAGPMNVMLEYHSLSEDENVRCILAITRTKQTQGIDVLRHLEATINFPSLSHVIEAVWRQCDARPGALVTVLSSGRLSDFAQGGNADMDVDAADAQEAVTPA